MDSEECPNCGRTVMEVNLHRDLGTCLFCDLNETGPADVEDD